MIVEGYYRDIWISLAIVLPIGAIGLLLLRTDPTAKGFLVLMLVVAASFIRGHIYERELRRRGLPTPTRHRT
jgi:hypothetical protein